MNSFEVLRSVMADQQGIVEEWMQTLSAQEHQLIALLGVEYMQEQNTLFFREYMKLPELQAAGSDSPDRYEGMSRIIQGLSLRIAQQGGNPHSFGPYASALKEILSRRLAAQETTDKLSFYEGMTAVDRTFNRIGNLYYEHYLNRREQVIKAQALAIQELSAPVIQVWNGIMALPLIGAIDTQRAKGIMENLLREIVRTKSPHVIIDITGVPIVDTGVAERLIKTVEAARLVGAECVLTGIRPEVAQTLVMLGVNLGDIVTKATLQAGLAFFLQKAASEREAVQRDATTNPGEESVS